MPYLAISLLSSLIATIFAGYSSGEVIAVISAIVAGTTTILAGGAAGLAKIIFAIKGIRQSVKDDMDQSALPTTPEQRQAFVAEIASEVLKQMKAETQPKLISQ